MAVLLVGWALGQEARMEPIRPIQQIPPLQPLQMQSLTPIQSSGSYPSAERVQPAQRTHDYDTAAAPDVYREQRYTSSVSVAIAPTPPPGGEGGEEHHHHHEDGGGGGPNWTLVVIGSICLLIGIARASGTPSGRGKFWMAAGIILILVGVFTH